MILGLETATNVCSVVFRDDDGSMHEKRIEKRGTHSEQLFLFIEELMEEHEFSIPDLDAVLVSQGPGSYTGLRISASAVKGLLFQTEIPLYGVNTLASFAMKARDENSSAETIHSIIDARRVHVYHQQFSFDDGKLSAKNDVEVIPIKEFESMVRKGNLIVGTGLNRMSKNIKEKGTVFGSEAISAKSLVRLYEEELSEFFHEINPEIFEPKYYTSNQVNNSPKT